jgi:hypothetical protein
MFFFFQTAPSGPLDSTRRDVDLIRKFAEFLLLFLTCIEISGLSDNTGTDWELMAFPKALINLRRR